MKNVDINRYDAVGELLCVQINDYNFKAESGEQISGTSYTLIVAEDGRSYNNVCGQHVITLKVSNKTRLQDLYLDKAFLGALYEKDLPVVGVNYYYDARFKRYMCSYAELISVSGVKADEIAGHHVDPEVWTEPTDR